MKLFVPGNEGGFAIDFDGSPLRARDSNTNKAFGSGTAGFLGSRRQTLGAQPIHCRFKVAIRFVKRLLTIHHAGARALAQFLYSGGGNLDRKSTRLNSSH